MGRKLVEHLTAASCVADALGPKSIELCCSPAHSAPEDVLGFLSSCRRAEKIHRESQYSTSP